MMMKQRRIQWMMMEESNNRHVILAEIGTLEFVEFSEVVEVVVGHYSMMKMWKKQLVSLEEEMVEEEESLLEEQDFH